MLGEFLIPIDLIMTTSVLSSDGEVLVMRKAHKFVDMCLPSNSLSSRYVSIAVNPPARLVTFYDILSLVQSYSTYDIITQSEDTDEGRDHGNL